MMMMEDETMDHCEDLRYERPVKTPQRKFGTDLSSSSRTNLDLGNATPVSAKKKVRVRKQHASAKKKALLQRHDEANETIIKNNAESTNDNNVYTIHFEPGPVGVKLEPVVDSPGGTEVGCRVMKFVDGGSDDPGQARKSGKIQQGDLIVAIDGKSVISWNYPDIVAFLKRKSSARGREISFRSVWSHQEDETTKRGSNNTVSTPPRRSAQTDEVQLSTPPPRDPIETPMSLGVLQSPSEAVLYSHVLDDPAPESPTRDSVASSTQEEESSGLEELAFSPSRVKELTSNHQHVTPHIITSTNTTASSSKPLSSVLKTVVKSVAPAAGVVAYSSYSLTSSLTSAMSTKLGEALVGHSSKEFDSAIQLKVQLLAELSQAKASLSRTVAEKQDLARQVDTLMSEKDAECLAKGDVERKLTALETENASLSSQLHETKVEKQDLNQQLCTFQLRISELSAENQRLQQESDEARRTREEWEAAFQKNEEMLHSRLLSTSQENARLHDSVSRLNADLAQKDSRMRELERQSAVREATAVHSHDHALLLDEVSTLRSELSRAHRNESSLSKELQDKQKELESAYKAGSKLRLELESRARRDQETLEKVKHYSSEANVTRAKLQESEATVEELRSHIASLESDLDASEIKLAAGAMNTILRSGAAEKLREIVTEKDATINAFTVEQRRLTERISELESKGEALRQQNSFLSDELTDSKVHLSASQKRVSYLEKTVDELESSKNDLKAKLQELNSGSSRILAQLAAAKSKAEDGKPQPLQLIGTSRADTSTADRELAVERERTQILEAKLREAMDEARSLRKELSKFQHEQLEETEKMLSDLDTLTAEHASERAARDSRIHELETLLQLAQDDIFQLRLELDKARLSHDDSKQESRLHAERELSELSKTLASEREEKNVLVEENGRLHESALRWENETEALRQEIEDTKKLLSADEKTRVELRLKCDFFEEEYLEATSRAEDAERESSSRARRIKRLEEDMEAVAREMDMLIRTNELLDNQLIEMKASRASSGEEAKHQRERTMALEESTVSLQRKLDEQSDRNSALLQQLQSLKDSLDKAKGREAALKDKKEFCAVELDRERTGRVAAEELVAQRNITIADLSEDLERLKLHLSTEGTKVARLEAAIVEAGEERDKAALGFQTELSRVQASLSETLDSRAALQAALNRCNNELERYRLQHGKLEKARAEAVAKLEEASNLVIQQKSAITAAEARALGAEASCNELNAQVASLQSSNETHARNSSVAKAELADLEERNRQLKADVCDAQREAAEHRKRISSLEETNSTLRSRVHELEAAALVSEAQLQKIRDSLSSKTEMSKQLSIQLEEKQTSVAHLQAQIRILEANVSRIKSESLLHQEAVQKTDEIIERSSLLNQEKEVQRLKCDLKNCRDKLRELSTTASARARVVSELRSRTKELLSLVEHVLGSREARQSFKALDYLDLAAPSQTAPTNYRREYTRLQSVVASLCSLNDDIVEHPSKTTTVLSDLEQVLLDLMGSDRLPRQYTERLAQGIQSLDLAIDRLYSDLRIAQDSVAAKDNTISQLEIQLCDCEAERDSLESRVSSLNAYIRNLEDSRPTSARRPDPQEKSSNDEIAAMHMKTTAARMICGLLQQPHDRAAASALHHWSSTAHIASAMEGQRHISEAMAQQLETTREKLALLKRHLKQDRRRRGETPSVHQQGHY